jgi:hypothetical protein
VLFGKPHSLGWIALIYLADPGQCRQTRKAFAEALHGAAFLIDRDKGFLARHSADRLHQRKQLIAVGEVARKQNDPGHTRRG